VSQVWKFELRHVSNIVEMPIDSEVLCAKKQRDVPCIWVRVDPEKEKVKRRFLIVGTGHEIPESQFAHYVGTFFGDSVGSYVWHVFEDVHYDPELHGEGAS